MLRELHIANLAVIEDATIELAGGLNVFTGQTGAGKSLIIGAFEMLLGLRTGNVGDMLRPGSEEGRVSGVFEVHDAPLAEQASELADQTIAPGDEVLITRKLFASGRSSVSINGQPATAGMVRQLGQLLVDIHGQHDHQYLLRPSNQLHILDAFAHCEADRRRFAELLAELRALRNQQAELTASQTLRRQQLELYEFQADEIDKLDPQSAEFPELQARHNVLNNLQRLQKEAGQAHAALYEAEGSIVERLQILAHLLGDLAELDEGLSPVSEQVRDAMAGLQDAAFELSRYVDRLEHNPAESAEVEQRLNDLNRLVQKYGKATPGRPDVTPADDPLAPVLAYREQIAREITKLRGQDAGLSQMDERMSALEAQLAEVGGRLSEARRKAAKQLRPMIESQLGELGMAEAKFDVQFEQLDADDEAVGPSGLDAIEFAVQTNPGQSMQPLRKIASGGELSRVMLAIKTILAGSDRTSVLVFDEIDANIGGRLGSVIGGKLRQLSRGGEAGVGRKKTKGKRDAELRHQVLCITHLPQIAAFGDRHLRIAKEVTGKGKSRQTRTTVSVLADDARVEELAEMLAGKQATATTRKQANEMLQSARG
ncbi:DNA repair protein RecN [Phycisphaerales bacterium AB-hyl4]|uniref:DNA repair protein RecN n=1 Tax=Natronomicrosphaera hydrolytica TaxID=3242702 RepID=A0ABV4U384_9BACT